MNDAMKFICRLTSNGANQGVIDSFSESNSYWFASILFKRFIRNNATIMYDPKNKCFGTRIDARVYDVTGMSQRIINGFHGWNILIKNPKRKLQKKISCFKP